MMGEISHAEAIANRFVSAFDGSGTPVGAERDDWMAMFAEDVVWEGPFWPEKALRLEGRQAVCAFLGGTFDSMPNYRFSECETCISQDADVVIIEATGGSDLRNGGRYDQRYCVLLKLRNGKIILQREYFNPLAVFEAFGREAMEKSFLRYAGIGQ